MNLPDALDKYKLNYNLSHLTWLKVGGQADVFFKPADEKDLISFLQQNAGKLPVTVLGAGSNVIISDQGVDGVVIKLGQEFTAVESLPDGSLAVGAGCLNFNLAKFALGHSLKGCEFLVGIPGTVGGGIAMNAGSYGSEFKDIVSRVYMLDKQGNEHQFMCDEMGFAYRKNSLPKEFIFTKVIFKAEIGDPKEIKAKMDEINQARAATQPVGEKTGGSTFANPVGHRAWQLIDAVGLRGVRVGGASMSTKHCNFMINHGDATASDMEDLGQLVKEKVYKQTGIELEWEIKRIGRNGNV